MSMVTRTSLDSMNSLERGRKLRGSIQILVSTRESAAAGGGMVKFNSGNVSGTNILVSDSSVSNTADVGQDSDSTL